MTVTKLSFFQCSFFDSLHKKILSETDSHCRNVLIQSISPKKPEKSQHCILGFLVSGIVNSAKLMNGRRRSDLWCIVWMHFNSPQKPAVAGCLSDIMSGSRSSGLPTAAVVEAQRGACWLLSASLPLMNGRNGRVTSWFPFSKKTTVLYQ